MEKNIIVRLFKVISIIIILAGVVFVVLTWINSDKLSENLDLQNLVLSPFFVVAYIALGLCILLAFLFPILNVFRNPKMLVKALIGLAIIVGLGFLFYSLSTNEFGMLQLQDYKISQTTSRQIGAALYGTYFIGALSIIAIFYAEIASFFKK